jgi:hypothetical protein
VGTGILVAAGFFLMQLAWMLTVPAATGIDEFDHIHRAASVASGHWGYSHHELGEKMARGGLIPVPKDIVAATNPACESFGYVGTANCNAYADAGGDLVLIACGAARYNPAFYALIGYPSTLFHGGAALAAMRVAAALLSAAMLGLGAVALRTWARTGWPLIGLFLAASPTVIYSSSIAAPNGLNIASGLTLWAALLGLSEGPDDAVTRRRLITISAVAAVTLVNTHTLGVMWLALIMAAVVVQRGRFAPPRVPRTQRRQAMLAVGITLVSLAFAAGWVLAARTNNPWDDSKTAFHQTWIHQVLTVGMPLWPLQAIGAFPMRDDPAPLAVYAIGVTLMLSLAVVAVRMLVRRRHRSPLLAIAFVVLASYAVPIVLTWLSFQHIGLAWQGRYQMPFTGGLLLLFALALDRAQTRVPVTLAVSGIGLVALMNFLGQLGVIHHFEGTRVAQAIGWNAPSALLLALMSLGFTVAGVVGVLAMDRLRLVPAFPESAAPDSANAPEPVTVPVT